MLGEDAECTILDGSLNGTVVTFNDVGAQTELSGFTIRNGLSFLGGGLYMEDSPATISRNIITGNAAVRNASGFLGLGGGIEIYCGAPMISNNLIVGNTAELRGGALDLYFADPILTNNTIVSNDAFAPGLAYAYGGAIYSYFSYARITSSLIYDNTSEGGGGGIDWVNSSYTVEFNDLYQNLPLNWSCVGCTNPAFPPPPGNVSVDPLLQGGTGSLAFCPRSHSPLVDGGSLTPPGATTDFFGRPRVLDGDFDFFAFVDVGFCETDEITMLTIDAGSVISWDPSANPFAVYNLYRGVLSELVASCATSCVYSQDPLVVLEARRECDLASPSFLDTDTPALTEGYYYLVSGEDAVEGGLGWLGGLARAHHNPCP